MCDVMICYCFKVKESAIRDAVQKGSKTLEEVMDATGAGYGCGSCQTRIKKAIAKINDNI